jgi:Phosphoesterase family
VTRAVAVALVLIALTACGGGSSKKAAPPPTTAPTPAAPTSTPSTSAGKTYDHVVWVLMENHSYRQVIGSSSAPYETALARQFGTASRYASVGSPSLPNYIGATSGSTQGISDDGGPQSHSLTVDNLFRQVRSVGKTERSFQESMPTNCNLGAVDTYAVKHNPAAYYAGGDDRAACRQDDVPFTDTLPRGPLPTFSFVTPNLCHDTHDCSVAAGDAWLKNFLPPLLASADYRAGTTVIFVVWDEYTPMPNIVISPTTPAGTVSAQAFDHYSLLRTTEELLSLPLLGRSASAASMRAAFHL